MTAMGVNAIAVLSQGFDPHRIPLSNQLSSLKEFCGHFWEIRLVPQSCFSERMLNFYLKLSESNIQGIALFKGTSSLVFDRQ